MLIFIHIGKTGGDSFNSFFRNDKTNILITGQQRFPDAQSLSKFDIVHIHEPRCSRPFFTKEFISELKFYKKTDKIYIYTIFRNPFLLLKSYWKFAFAAQRKRVPWESMPFVDIDCTKDLISSPARPKNFFESDYALSFENLVELISSGYIDEIKDDENIFDIGTNGGIFKYLNMKDPQTSKLKMFIGDDCMRRNDFELTIIPTECMASAISKEIINNNLLTEYFWIKDKSLIRENAFSHFNHEKNKTVIKQEYEGDFRLSTDCDTKLVIKYLQRNIVDYKTWLRSLRFYTQDT